MQQLVICVVGQNKLEHFKILIKAILECGGNITDSRMMSSGDQFTLMMSISGSWDTIVKIEASLPRLQTPLALQFIAKRTELPPKPTQLLPYMVEIVALYHPRIVYEIVDFFTTHNINIEDMNSHCYTATETGAPMFSLTFTIYIPATLSIANLRSEFTELCDELNLDSIMGPIK